MAIHGYSAIGQHSSELKKVQQIMGGSWEGFQRHSRWFERLVAELHCELWVGDPAQIRAKRARKQK